MPTTVVFKTIICNLKVDMVTSIIEWSVILKKIAPLYYYYLIFIIPVSEATAFEGPNIGV